MDKESFAKRLSTLRLNKGVSARDMSLSIGLSEGYINNVENRVNYPSMEVFFYICEYLDITPAEFFDTNAQDPTKARALYAVAKGLSGEQLDTLIVLAKGLKK